MARNTPVVQALPASFYQVAIGMSFLLAIQSWLLGLGVITATLLAWMLWRRGIPAVVTISLLYQWLFANVGYWVWSFTGAYPDSQIVGDIDQAVLISNLGLLTVALGVVVCSRFLSIDSEPEAGFLDRLNLSRLFRWTIVAYALGWVILVSPSSMWFGGAQIIYNVLLFRDGLLVLLIWGALRQRSHFRPVGIAICFAALPAIASPQAKLSHYLFLVIAVLLSEWRTVAGTIAAIHHRKRIARYTVVIVAGTFLYAALWLGGIKATWRQMSREGQLAGSTVGRLSQMSELLSNSREQVGIAAAIDTSSKRFSSDLLYFAFALERVPYAVPHENGRLTYAAFRHVFTPRFLFPNKPVLRNASWMVRKYAGVACADETTGTSVSFGYMAELYVDWGRFWMFFPLLMLGALIAVSLSVLQRSGHSVTLGTALFLPLCLQHFNGYGSDVTNLLGGSVQTVIISAVILHYMQWPIRANLLSPIPRSE